MGRVAARDKPRGAVCDPARSTAAASEEPGLHAIHAGDPIMQDDRILRTVVWSFQWVLILAFAFLGTVTLFEGVPELMQTQAWTYFVPPPLVHVIGACELVAVLGLVAPSVGRFPAFLEPLAAAGLTALMILACLFWIERGQGVVAFEPALLGVMAAVVAWARWTRLPAWAATGQESTGEEEAGRV